MKRTTTASIAALVGLWTLSVADGRAGGATPEESEHEAIDAEEDTVTGGKPLRPLGEGALSETSGALTLETDDGQPYPPNVYRGAKQLHLDVEFVAEAWYAVEALYMRDYKGAQARFGAMASDRPGTGIGHVGQALVWQALMLENFDFKYENQYRVAYNIAMPELQKAVEVPGNDGFEYFLLGGLEGVEAIHNLRKGEVLDGFGHGVSAMTSVSRCKELVPDFVDTILGDGMFNYWRTVIAMNSKAIPNLGDDRQLGIEQMTKVEAEGVFLSAPATLSLTYTWIEERRFNRALQAALRNHEVYPDNVINNLVLGRVYLYLKSYDASERAFREVLLDSPRNERVHYYMAKLFLRQGKFDQALASLDTYLAFDLADDFRAYAQALKGDVYFWQKQYDEAYEWYRAAWKTDKVKRAKERMDQIRVIQKQGG